MLVKRGWRKRQDTLKQWRDRIWDNNDTLGIKTYVDWHLDFFTRFYKSKSPHSRLLDIGCGYMLKNFHEAGRLDELMQLIKCNYTGIDPISDWFVNSDHFVFELHQGNGEQLPFGDGQFDSVMLLGVLDHVMDTGKVLSEAHRVLKNGGTLWFANSYIEGSARHIWKMKLYHRIGFDEHHRYAWRPRDLESMISKASFSIVRTDKCLCDVSYYIEGVKE